MQNDPDYIEKVRKYNRERKKITSRKEKGKTSTPQIMSQLETPVKKPPSYYKVLSTSKKVQQLLGPSPKMHTTILKHILNKAIRSPRKNQCMGEFTSPPKNYVMPPPKESVGKHLRKIAILRNKKKYKKAEEVAASLKSRFRVSEIAAMCGGNVQAVKRLLSPEEDLKIQKEYSKKLTKEDKDEVVKIYYDDEVSFSLPDMKYEGLRFMHFTLREAYEVYMRKCQCERIVATKTFERLKPKNVRTVQETPLRGARCEYCANFGKTRDALIGLGMKGIPRNHAQSIEVT